MPARKQNSSNALNEQVILTDCPINSFFFLLGGRWKLTILWHLHQKERRFHQLQQCISGISDKMLSQQLKNLSELGFINRLATQDIPVQVTYALTEKGQTLIPLLLQIFDWGIENNITDLAETRKQIS